MIAAVLLFAAIVGIHAMTTRGSENARSSIINTDCIEAAAGPMLEMVTSELRRGRQAVPTSDPDTPGRRPTHVSRRRLLYTQCNGLCIAILTFLAGFFYMLAKNESTSQMLQSFVNSTGIHFMTLEHKQCCACHPFDNNTDIP